MSVVAAAGRGGRFIYGAGSSGQGDDCHVMGGLVLGIGLVWWGGVDVSRGEEGRLGAGWSSRVTS